MHIGKVNVACVFVIREFSQARAKLIVKARWQEAQVVSSERHINDIQGASVLLAHVRDVGQIRELLRDQIVVDGR